MSKTKHTVRTLRQEERKRRRTALKYIVALLEANEPNQTKPKPKEEFTYDR